MPGGLPGGGMGAFGFDWYIITKTKTPNFTPKYNFKFEETDRTEDNLMD